MKTLIVAGRFDQDGGRPSGYAAKLFDLLDLHNPTFASVFFNGGSLNDLKTAFDMVSDRDVIYWFADVPNDQPKLLDTIKVINPRAILISSKNNALNRYDTLQLIARALKAKSNLLVEFTKKESPAQSSRPTVQATILDPLGNAFTTKEESVDIVRLALLRRVKELYGMTRIGSQRVGLAIAAPDMPEFFELIRAHADRFHELIHAVNQSRFLGNVSFRCMHGFPSFRADGRIFVSRRNVDKRDMNASSFVAVDLPTDEGGPRKVLYYGEAKPSVDTPVQVQLYSALPNLNFMLHSHVYVKGAPFTDRILPCGAIEEANEILGLLRTEGLGPINLRGHGSLLLSETLKGMQGFEFEARKFPEPHAEGLWGPS